MARFSLVLNNTPKDFLATLVVYGKATHCPLIFTLEAESLSQLLVRSHEKKLVQGFSVNEDGDTIPVIQYVDDTMIFLKADVGMSKNLCSILLWFKAISGLQVNLAMSKVYFLNEVTVDQEILGV